MVTKVINKIKGWHLKILSTGGRVVLNRHVLSALNIHTQATVHPLKGTIDMIEKYIARFFWTSNEVGGKHHWVSWTNPCFPYEEGGAKFRSCRTYVKLLMLSNSGI